MKLVVNISNNLGGGGMQVAVSFLKACIGYPENEYHVFLRTSLNREINASEFPSNFIFHPVPELKFYRLGRYLSRLEKVIVPEVVFSVFGPVYWRPKAVHVMGFAQGYYIYPDSPFWKTLPGKERLMIALKKTIHTAYMKRDADAVICETEDATNRVRKLLGAGKSYFTVSNTCGEQFANPMRVPFSGELPERRPGEFRLLTVCKYYSHKNLTVIDRVLECLFRNGIRNIRFVLTILPEEFERLFASKYHANVCTVGPVLTEECPALYDQCDAVFMPSLIECFSANYPEAMITGKPILTSDLGFARTICQDTALYFDPLDSEDIAAKIKMLWEDKALQRMLVEKGEKRIGNFPDARERARQYLNICKNLINK